MERVITSNDEAIEAWNGVLFDRFVEFRDVVVTALGKHGEEAMRRRPPNEGDRVLDIGCGFGDTSQELARIVGPEGSVLGVDAAERFVEAARAEAGEAGVENVRFEVADVEGTAFDETFDYAFSRFGTMFFANPVAALRNVRNALAPGGHLCMVVWRAKAENDWVYRAEQVVERFVEEPDPDESDEPTCGPGPFSMANADTTSGILVSAGFEEIELVRQDIDYLMGVDMQQAIALITALGPAGEIIRLAGEEAEKVRPEIEAALAEALSEFETPEGVIAASSTWAVSARVPRKERA